MTNSRRTSRGPVYLMPGTGTRYTHNRQFAYQAGSLYK